ncbi:hypothetical protein SK128_027300, partial [Halocaridina rubra]
MIPWGFCRTRYGSRRFFQDLLRFLGTFQDLLRVLGSFQGSVMILSGFSRSCSKHESCLVTTGLFPGPVMILSGADPSMKAVWLLLASILCVTVWMDDLTSAEMASTRGHFIKTGPGYRDTVPKGALTDSLINSANIVTGDSNSPIAALECGRKCLETAGCLSVAIKPSNHTCFLTSLDKCQAKKSIMDKAPG